MNELERGLFNLLRKIVTNTSEQGTGEAITNSPYYKILVAKSTIEHLEQDAFWGLEDE